MWLSGNKLSWSTKLSHISITAVLYIAAVFTSKGNCLLLKSYTKYNIKKEIKIYIKKENYDLVQIYFIAASVSPVSNKPLHKLRLSL